MLRTSAKLLETLGPDGVFAAAVTALLGPEHATAKNCKPSLLRACTQWPKNAQPPTN